MLEINNITYYYEPKHKVFSGFNLKFNESGVYGLLGKNGTGKSTLLYLVSGLLRAKSGEIVFDGMKTEDRNPQTMQEIFLVPEEYNLPHVSLKKYIDSICPFYPNFDETLLHTLLAEFDMPAEVNLGELSMGQKKKVYMCIALAARTRLLLMDEPTNGLDILAKSQFRKVIAQGMREDQIIVISTHQVRDVELLLDHVTIVNKNEVLYSGRVNVEERTDLEELFINTLTRKEIAG